MEQLLISSKPAEGDSSVIIVSVDGTLGINTLDAFENKFQEFMNRGNYKLILDAKNLTYVSSAGFGFLLAMKWSFRKKNGDIKFINLNPDMNKLLELLDLQEFFHIHDTN